LIFLASGQVISSTFDLCSTLESKNGAQVTLTGTNVPNIRCDNILSGISSTGAAVLANGTIAFCSMTGFTTLHINPGIVVTVISGQFGSPNENSTVFIAQAGRLVLEGFNVAYSNIFILGQVSQRTGSTLVVVDATIWNRGFYNFLSGVSTLIAGSLIYTDPAKYPSWFQNYGGIFQSEGSPQIGIKYNNTGGIMLANVDSTDCPDTGIVVGGFEFTVTSARQIFYLSTFAAEDRVNIFNYDNFYNRAPYHNPSPDPNNPAGCFGLRYQDIIILPQVFSPTLNGYFSNQPTYGQLGGEPSVFVTYTYNGFRNYVPDGPKTGSSARPRILVVGQGDNNGNYTRFLTLTAGSPILISSLLSLLSVLSLFMLSF